MVTGPSAAFTVWFCACKPDLERRAAALAALHVDRCSEWRMVLDDAPYDREADPRSMRSRREESVEDLGGSLSTDARPLVDHAHRHALSRSVLHRDRNDRSGR